MSDEQTKSSASLSIRYAIPVMMGLLIVIAVALTGWLAFQSGVQSAEGLAIRLGEEVSLRIEEHVQSFLEIPHIVHQVNQANIKAEALDISDTDQLRRVFFYEVQITDSVPYVYLGTEEDYFIGMDSNFGPDQITVFKMLDGDSYPDRVTYSVDDTGGVIGEIERKEYHPIERPWYQAAVEANQGTWGPVYVFSARPILGISPTLPVFSEEGDLVGVLGIDLTLEELTEFMRTLEISPNGQAYVIEHTGAMIATSTDELPYTINEETGTQSLKNVLDSENPDLQATADFMTEFYGDLVYVVTDEDGIKSLQFDIDEPLLVEVEDLEGERFFVQLSPLTDERGLDWITIVIIPTRDFMGPVYENLQRTAIFGGIVLVVATAIGMYVGWWIINPLFVITDVADQIEDSVWNLEPLDGVATRTDEIGVMARVFRRMAKEVQQRETKLKRQVEMLKIEIDRAKQQEQVSEIVDSDFFQGLQEKAKDIRKRRDSRSKDSEEESGES